MDQALHDIPPSLLEEGTAMLQALALDLSSSKEIAVGLILDPRMEDALASLPWVQTCSIPWQRAWIEFAQQCDHVIVIAPEFDSILQGIVETFRSQGISVLASDPTFLKQSVDKWQTFEAWRRAGIETPPTCLAEQITSANDLFQLGARSANLCDGWTVKRRDGAGCWEQTRWLCDRALLVHLDSLEDRSSWIVQPWIQGTPASISWFFGSPSYPIGCCYQEIRCEHGKVHYDGGRPMGGHQDIPQEIVTFSERAIQALDGKPSGWIGLDWIRSSSGKLVAVEINPRLTTSYLTLRGHREDPTTPWLQLAHSTRNAIDRTA